MRNSKEAFQLQVPMGEKTVLLHTCCAPCSSAIIECMLQNGITPVIYYCNPNIYPKEEYEIRKNECTRYAKSLGLEIVDADYDHEIWLETVRGLENEPERGSRCMECFKMRLLRTAGYACSRGIKVITTTLASSRWKSLDQINAAGIWACNQISGMYRQGLIRGRDRAVYLREQIWKGAKVAGRSETETGSPAVMSSEVETSLITWWNRNWRKHGLQERRLQIIKEYGFYNQRYCGCEFSMPEED